MTEKRQALLDAAARLVVFIGSGSNDVLVARQFAILDRRFREAIDDETIQRAANSLSNNGGEVPVS